MWPPPPGGAAWGWNCRWTPRLGHLDHLDIDGLQGSIGRQFTSAAQERLRILNRAETIAAREAPVVPIYVYTRTRLIHPAVKNFQPRALDNWLWKHLDLHYPVPPSSMDALLTATD